MSANSKLMKAFSGGDWPISLCDKISSVFKRASNETLFSKVYADCNSIGSVNYFWVQAVPVRNIKDAYAVTKVNLNENGFLTGIALGKDSFRLGGRSPWMTRAEAKAVIASYEEQCQKIRSYKEATIEPRRIESSQFGSYLSPLKNAALALKRALVTI